MCDPESAAGVSVLEVMTDGFIALDRRYTYLYVNPQAAAVIGRRPEDLIGRTLWDFFVPGEIPEFHRAIETAMREGSPQRIVHHLEHHGVWLETRVFPTPEGVAAFFQDITDRKEVELELERRERRYAVLAHAVSHAVWEADAEGRPLPSASWSNLTGRADERTPDAGWIEAIHEDDREAVEQAWADAVRTGREFDRTYRVRRRDGAWRHVRARGVPVVENGRILQWIGVLEDVTAELEAEETLRRAAMEDALTGLPNRPHFLEHLEAVLCRREHERSAVLYADVDRFKAVNDAEGHEGGDRLLQTVADRMTRQVRPSDVASRLSGDEFAVLLDGVADGEEAVAIARRIAAAVRGPAEPSALDVTISIGLKMIEEDDADAEAVLRAADAAMYDVKARGGDGVEVHDQALRERLRRRATIEEELRDGLVHDALELHFQPIVPLAEPDRAPSVEALLRWHSRAGPVVPAEEAVQVAERTGLIVPIGREVLRFACRQAARWQASGRRISVAVNVSPRQITGHERLVADVLDVLDETGLPSDLLHLEITESVLMESTADGESMISELRDVGVVVAIDDFGVGYSSLSYLHRLPVAEVKIDRSFVARLPEDDGSARIVEAVVGVARAFGVRVVAEGIERRDQLQVIRALGCDAVQGYLVAPPVPFSELPAVLDAAQASVET